jgi:hypothetical protein
MSSFYKIKVDDKKNSIEYKSKEIYNKLNKYFFIKTLPQNILSLHNKIHYLDLIKKNKFICTDKTTDFFSILNTISYNKYDRILSISTDRCIIEPIKFYFKNAEITNIFYNNSNIKNIGEKINKIKQNYIFSDVSIDMINDNDKFNLIIVDTVSKLLIDNKENDYNAYVKMEKGNALLLEKMNDILQHLNKGEQSILYLFIQSFIDESTLLAIQHISQFFKKCKIVNLFTDNNKTEFFNFVFEDFIGIVEPLPYLSNKFMKSIKRFYKNFFEELEDYKLRYEMIKSNLDNKEYIKSLKIQNLAYSYKFAQELGFDVYKNILIDDADNSTYGVNIKKNDILLQSLQKMFSLDEGIYTVMRNRDKGLQMNIKVSDDTELPEQIGYYNRLKNISTRQIDFRPIHIWDETKKFIRYYEHTLNIYLQNYRISIEKTKPVSRAWIKFYELLFVTKIFDKLEGDLKVFHICEAPGTFIMSTIYYLNRWNKNLRYDWDATTLNPKFLSKNGIGDTYDLLKKYKDKWTFGFDGTGDITVEKNIKHYRELCKDRDFIIGDCGLPWGDDSIPGIVLYYSQMLFILYNLKEGGGCIFKQILNFEHKILVDMVYLLYYCFDVVKVYKPVQNGFSGEMYIVCTRYKKLLKDKDFDILFAILDDKKDIHKKSIITEEYKKEFIYQFANTLEKIIVNFNQAIDRQLFYADFWDLIQHEDKDEIKKYIDIKNKDWVETYLLKTVVK